MSKRCPSSLASNSSSFWWSTKIRLPNIRVGRYFLTSTRSFFLLIGRYSFCISEIVMYCRFNFSAISAPPTLRPVVLYLYCLAAEQPKCRYRHAVLVQIVAPGQSPPYLYDFTKEGYWQASSSLVQINCESLLYFPHPVSPAFGILAGKPPR